MKILFVCSSNVCRSPFAEFVFGRLVEQSPVLSAAGIEVGSSAVFNRSKYIYPKAVVSLEREGFSKEAVLAHKPAYKSTDKKRFEEADVIIGMSKEADVIIGMSKIHRILTPHKYRDKFVTLSEAATGKYTPIPDPFLYPSQNEYDKVMSVIKKYLTLYAEKLERELAPATANGEDAKPEN